ncbi:DUF2530 domain-containing protein [Ornithinimicrobium tianjinense]|uniref:DUF2530 domain-containing protein n=1 Tax=Ornithinimicrobium tianjinense TaxID=1195761 RepID=UPI0016629119|nr:DUF2530 domain-containing protein [Ornithinimicrobium tianjinense]
MDERTTPTATGIVPPEVPLRTVTLAKVGLVAWAVALLVILVVPTLRTGERSWWVWVPVAGLVLGAAGYVYLRRGRGNAAMA